MALGGLFPSSQDLMAGPFGATPGTPQTPGLPSGPFANAAAPAAATAQPVIPGPFGQAPQGQPSGDSFAQKLRMVVPALVAAFGPKFGARKTAAMLGGILRGQEAKRAQTERAEQTAARRAMDAARFRMDALEQVASLPPEQQAVYLESLADVGMQLYGVDLRGELGRMQGASAATRTRVEGEQATAKQKADAASVVKANDQTNPGNWSAPDETGQTRPREWWVARAGTPGLLPGKAEKKAPISVAANSRLVDPETNEVLVDAETPPQAGFSLGPGQVRYWPDGTELARGPAPREPQGPQPDFEWVVRSGQPLQIRKGTAQPGDVPYDATAARQAATVEGGPSSYSMERNARTLQSVDELLGKVNRWTTGVGSTLSAIPESDARNFKAELDTLKANIAFNELTQMREASKTGGALGQVSNIELGLLTAALGALDTGQSPENLKAQLQKIRSSIERFNAAQSARPAGRGAGGGPGAGSPKVGDTKTFPNGNKARWDGQGWAQVP